jgi:hypothetical protein
MHIHFCERSLHQRTNVGLATAHDLLEMGCGLEPSGTSAARPNQRLRHYR